MGLAIYNHALLDIHFPTVCFKKLLGKAASLDDLKELDLELACGLEYILHYEGADLESALYVNFMMETEFFGESQKFYLIVSIDYAA
jgi:hypothetical protein